MITQFTGETKVRFMCGCVCTLKVHYQRAQRMDVSATLEAPCPDHEEYRGKSLLGDLLLDDIAACWFDPPFNFIVALYENEVDSDYSLEEYLEEKES